MEKTLIPNNPFNEQFFLAAQEIAHWHFSKLQMNY